LGVRVRSILRVQRRTRPVGQVARSGHGRFREMHKVRTIMSEPTPRTDRTNKFVSRESGITWVEIEFARLLERELAASRAAEQKANERADQAEARAEALRVDAERYRWLRKTIVDDCDIWVARGCHATGISNWREEPLDAAIDEAREVKP
jgi:hypothetical protein